MSPPSSFLAPVYGLVTEAMTHLSPAQIQCRPELRQATLPILNNTIGQLLGVAEPLAILIAVVLAFSLIAFAATRLSGWALRGIGITIIGVILIFMLPDIINAFSRGC